MTRKTKIDYQTRLEIVRKRMELEISIENLSSMYGCCKSAIKRYLALYHAHGVSGLKIKGNRNSTYTYDFKTQVIKAFLSGKSKNKISFNSLILYHL